MAPKQKREKLVPVKTTLHPIQDDFLKKVIKAGKALNKADALRYIVTAAIEKKIINLEEVK